MPRKKPTSTTKKKAEQLRKRAIKRGEVEAPEKVRAPHRKRRRVGPTGNRVGPGEGGITIKKLESSFIKLSQEFLEETKVIASTVPLQRPLPPSVAILESTDTGKFDPTALSCISRPKWRFDMSKLEVERNEEGMFKKWLAENDQTITAWQEELDAKRKADLPEFESPKTMPASPSYFERNIEVWRQLWRVTEISQILLILVDSRCPNLHFPPSLATYFQKLNQKFILVLTKVDITGAERTEAWKAYLREKHPGIPIVEVEAYIAKDESAVHQGRRKFEWGIPENFRVKFIETIKKVHAELKEPPAEVKEKPERLKNWVSPVKLEVDWEALVTAKGDKVGLAVGGPAAPRPAESEDEDDGNPSGDPETHERRVPEVLTIGLIGQPNVGKSSLLNALFGAPKVTASKTPGKTKHFQTLFWTQDVRLVDCPGLIFPNFVPMEMQVLSGILPISRVSAVSTCIHFASQRLPLERIFQLRHPSLDEAPKVDKRTWRDGMARRTEPDPPQVDSEKEKEREKSKLVWTATDVLTMYANAKGWVTAKAGRPDIHRAGNALLRALAEGRVPWGFWPPGHELSESDEGQGIWIPGRDAVDSDEESEDEAPEQRNSESQGSSVEAEGADTDDDGEDGEEEESDDDQEEDDVGQNVGLGRFGALAIDGGEESDDASD